MGEQQVVVETHRGGKVTKQEIIVPDDAELLRASAELRNLGRNEAPAAGRYGSCIGLYFPSRECWSTIVDPFSGERGTPARAQDVDEKCVFAHDSGILVAIVVFDREPPWMYRAYERAKEPDPSLFNHLSEGSARVVESTAYERNPHLRTMCLRIHGMSCAACGMSFASVYGDVAVDFIHVHHLNPLAAAAGPHRVDPSKDLVPLCPNCHAVAHLKDPPYTPQEIRQMLGSVGFTRKHS